MERVTTKRVFALLLALMMIFALLPSAAFANDTVSVTATLRIVNDTLSVSAGAPWNGTRLSKTVTVDCEARTIAAFIKAAASGENVVFDSTGKYITSVAGLAQGAANQEYVYDGWMILLNDWCISTDASEPINDGDEITIAYSMTMGEDLGGSWSNNDKTLKALSSNVGTFDKSFDKSTHAYTLNVPYGTQSVKLTPTATNKYFQVRASIGATEYSRSAAIPVSNGTVITVTCGDPSWPSMNNGVYGNGAENVPAETYTVTIAINHAPALAEGVDAAKSENVVAGREYSLDLSTIFTDADGDELTYFVKIGDADFVAAAKDFAYTPAASGATVLVFKASDGDVESASYTLTLTAGDNSAPALSGAETTTTANVYTNEAYTLDLSTIFTDANGDALSYSVKIGEADFVAAAKDYSYTPTTEATTALVFKASDGDAESVSYTVNLTSTYKTITYNIADGPVNITTPGRYVITGTVTTDVADQIKIAVSKSKVYLTLEDLHITVAQTFPINKRVMYISKFDSNVDILLKGENSLIFTSENASGMSHGIQYSGNITFSAEEGASLSVKSTSSCMYQNEGTLTINSGSYVFGDATINNSYGINVKYRDSSVVVNGGDITAYGKTNAVTVLQNCIVEFAGGSFKAYSPLSVINLGGAGAKLVVAEGNDNVLLVSESQDPINAKWASPNALDDVKSALQSVSLKQAFDTQKEITVSAGSDSISFELPAGYANFAFSGAKDTDYSITGGEALHLYTSEGSKEFSADAVGLTAYSDAEFRWEPSAITISAPEGFETLAENSSVVLSTSYEPAEAMPNIEWSSSDTAVATVDKDGVVKFVSVGNAVITATCPENDVYGTFNITTSENEVAKAVRLTVKPVGATLVVTNGISVFAPSSVNAQTNMYLYMLAPGEYTYTLSKEGYTESTDSFIVTQSAGVSKSISLSYDASFTLLAGNGVTNIEDAVITLTSKIDGSHPVGNNGVYENLLGDYDYTITLDGCYDEAGTLSGAADIKIQLNKDLETGDIQWYGAYNNAAGDGNNVVNLPLPTSSSDTYEAWKTHMALDPGGSMPGAYAGQSCIVGDYLYITAPGVAGAKTKLVKMRISDGSTVKQIETNLDLGIQFSGSWVYDYSVAGDGMILVSNGDRIMAFDYDLNFLWRTNIGGQHSVGVDGEMNSHNTVSAWHPLVYHDGYIFSGRNIWKTTNFKVDENGYNLPVYTIDDDFSWSTGVIVGDIYYVSATQTIYAINFKTGEEVDRWRFSTDKKHYTWSGVAYSSEDNRLYWASYGGAYMHSVSLAENGSFVESSKIIANSTQEAVTTPVIYNGRVYLIGQGVGGSVLPGVGGGMDVFDSETLELIYSAPWGKTTLGYNIGKVQCTPILNTAYENSDPTKPGLVYIYFQGYYNPAEIYAFVDWEGNTTAQEKIVIATPSSGQFNMEQIAMDKAGNIYFFNESGYLFGFHTTTAKLSALSAAEATQPIEFFEDELNYDVAVLPETESLTVNFTLPQATSATVNGVENNTGTAVIEKPESGEWKCVIVTTKEGDSRTRDYTIVVHEAATSAQLSDLLVSTSNTFNSSIKALSPAFSASTYEYEAAAVNKSYFNFWPVLSDSTASFVIKPVFGVKASKLDKNGYVGYSATNKNRERYMAYFDDGAAYAIFDIIVTAEDGVTKNTYRVTVQNQGGVVAPTRRTDVASVDEATVGVGCDYTLDLSEIFTADAAMSYLVSVDGADYVSAAEKYAYTMPANAADGDIKILTFKAATVAESTDTYKVFLTAETDIPTLNYNSVNYITRSYTGSISAPYRYVVGANATALELTLTEAGQAAALGTLSVQWYESTDNITYKPIEGATGWSYTPSTDTVGTKYYQPVVRDSISEFVYKDTSIVLAVIEVYTGYSFKVGSKNAAENPFTIKLWKVENGTETAVSLPEPAMDSNGEYNVYSDVVLSDGTYRYEGFDSEGRSLGGATMPIDKQKTGYSTNDCATFLLHSVKFYTDPAFDAKSDYKITSLTHEAGYEITPKVLEDSTTGRLCYYAMVESSVYKNNYAVLSYNFEEVGDSLFNAGYAAKSTSLTYTANAQSSYAVLINAKIALVQVVSLTVPSSSTLFVGSKSAHYVPFAEQTAIKTIVNDDDTTTYSYALTKNSIYNLRLTTPGYVTYTDKFKAAGNSFTIALTDLVATENAAAAATDKYANDIYLNVNKENHLSLAEVGDTKDLVALRVWQTVDTMTNNYYTEPDFHYTVISGEDVVSISESGLITATKEGEAVILVTYDALQSYDMNGSGDNLAKTKVVYGALDAKNIGVIGVTVGSEAVSTGIDFDADLSTKYYAKTINDEVAQTGSSYTFTPDSDVTSVTVMHFNVADNNTVDYSAGFTAEGVSKSGDSYTVTLTEGRNLIRIEDSDGNVAFQSIRSAGVLVRYENLTSESGVNPGDKLNITVSGWSAPLFKLSGIYNPQGSKIVYESESGADLQSTSNSFGYTIPASCTDESLKLQNGKISITWFGDYLYETDAGFKVGMSHRALTSAGRGVNLAAPNPTALLSELPDIDIPITQPATRHIASFKATQDIDVTLVDASGNPMAETEAGSNAFALPKGSYTYTVSGNGIATQSKSFSFDNTEDMTISVPLVLSTAADEWDGTESAPEQIDGVYQISNAKELSYFVTKISGSANAVLTADIYLSTTNEWVVTSAATYTGIFDGAGHTIYNMANNQNTQYKGLFNLVGAGATVKNLTVTGSFSNTVSVGYNKQLFWGGIAARMSGATIENCISRVDMNGFVYAMMGQGAGDAFVGGISGSVYGNNSNINGCVNYGTLNINGYRVGGIVGGVTSGTVKISECANFGNISSRNYAGGILGGNSSSSKTTTIENCVNNGDVATSYTYCGGISGYAGGAITGCVNNGSISGSSYVGGIAAYNNAALAISDCYNTGAVTGTLSAGIIGYLSASKPTSIENCYSIGKVGPYAIFGGKASTAVEGTNYTIEDCFYLDSSVPSGSVELSENCKALTAAELKNADTLEKLGTGFKADSVSLNFGYPILAWQNTTPQAVIAANLNTAVVTYAVDDEAEYLQILASGDNLSYQWFKKGAADTEFAAIDYAVSAFYMPDTSVEGTTQYYVRVTSAIGTATNSVDSAIATIKVGSSTVAGDVDGDGAVDGNDLSTMLSNFGLSNKTAADGDLTGDGTVDGADLAMLLANFGL